MTIEFYPVSVSYNDAATSEGDRSGIRSNYNCEFIHGMYRVGDASFLEIALQYASYPSFCGGAYAHSPQSRIVSERAWGGMLERGYKVSHNKADEFSDGIIDLRKHVEGSENWSDAQWKEYGYRALGNALITKLTMNGKRGCVLSGPIHAEAAQFCEQMALITFTRKAQVEHHGVLPWEYRLAVNNTVQSCPVKVQVQETEAWVNFNSSNECKWFPIVITSDMLGGEEGYMSEDSARERAYEHFTDMGLDDDDYYFDEWYDQHYSDYQFNSEDVIEGPITQDEMDYAAIAGDYVRRYSWSN